MRIRTIDECLRRRHRDWTIEDLRKACEDALYEYEGVESLSARTVQRDIQLMRSGKLGYEAPIVVVDHKYYEYEDPEFSITQLPFSAADLDELGRAVDILKHYSGFVGMEGQEDILTRIQDQISVQRSNQQIVFIETNKLLKGLHFLSDLYNFIQNSEPIVVKYRSFKSAKDSSINISPYFLNEYNNRWFLVGYNERMHNVMTLALDRMISVEKDTEKPFIKNVFFEPSEYLGTMIGVTRDLKSKTMRVLLKFDADQAPYALTKPLHSSQEVVKQNEDGSVLVRIEVVHNLELEGAILRFGSHVEVIAPRILRHRIANQVILAADRYRKKG